MRRLLLQLIWMQRQRVVRRTMPSTRTWRDGTNAPHGSPTMDDGSTAKCDVDGD
jgi:hypothetical protein